jgi:hypothetical protein
MRLRVSHSQHCPVTKRGNGATADRERGLAADIAEPGTQQRNKPQNTPERGALHFREF